MPNSPRSKASEARIDPRSPPSVAVGRSRGGLVVVAGGSEVVVVVVGAVVAGGSAVGVVVVGAAVVGAVVAGGSEVVVVVVGAAVVVAAVAGGSEVVVVVVGAAVVVVGATRVGLPSEHPSTARADRTSTTITRHVPHRTPSRNIGGFLSISVPIRSSGSLPR